MDYQRCVSYWNQVFSKENDGAPNEVTSGNALLGQALIWLCDGASRVLDFGCGNGVMLFLCAQNGTQDHFGIDLSDEAINCAKRKATQMSKGTYIFKQGGVESLSAFPSESFDAVILSNIVDNLYPEDALRLRNEAARILKNGGKALIKLNPYLTQEQISVWGIRVISGHLLNDGLLLWNNTTEEWHTFFSAQFEVYHETEIYYPEHEQTNRLLCLIKN